MNSHITVEMYPLQLSGHKFFQIFIPVHVIYNFSKIPYTDIVFIPSTGIYYQVVPVREQQLSILPLDGFETKQKLLYDSTKLPDLLQKGNLISTMCLKVLDFTRHRLINTI